MRSGGGWSFDVGGSDGDDGAEAVAEHPDVVVGGEQVLGLLVDDGVGGIEQAGGEGGVIGTDGYVFAAFALFKDREIVAFGEGGLEIDPAAMERGAEGAIVFGLFSGAFDEELEGFSIVGALIGVAEKGAFQGEAGDVGGGGIEAEFAVGEALDEVVELFSFVVGHVRLGCMSRAVGGLAGGVQ